MPDDPMSLFSSSSNIKKKPVKKAETRALPPKPPPLTEALAPLSQTIIDPETESMIQSIRERQKELEDKLSKILRQGHMLPLELQDLLKDISNWPEGKQDEIINRANLIVNSLNEAIGTGTAEAMDRKKSKKDDKRTQKAQKIRGKRNWISMQ